MNQELKRNLLTKPSYFKESYKTIAQRFNVSLDDVHRTFKDPEVYEAKRNYNNRRSSNGYNRFYKQQDDRPQEVQLDRTAILELELSRIKKQLNAIRQDPSGLNKVEETSPNPYTTGDPKNILIIGDTHVPFERKGYLEFCRKQQEKFNCGTVVHIGDVVDQHFSSFHESNPDGMSAGYELELSIERLKRWNHTFPKVKACFGNHDLIIQRQAFSAGLSYRWIKDFNEVLGLPGWEFDMEHEIDGVVYTHGTGTSGDNGAFNKALNRRKSIVSGHLHTIANIKWNVSEIDRIFSMQVGCVDRDTEFLSPNGWKKIGDYSGELVGQYNEDGTVTFVKPIKYIKEKATELNKISTNYGVSQVFCDDHNVVYVNRTGQLAKISGSTFVTRHTSNVNGFDGKFIVAYNLNSESHLDLTDDQIRLQVAVHADGTFPTRNQLNTCQITTRKERKISRLKNLLDKLGLEYSQRTYKDGITRFTFQAPLRSKNYDKSWYKCSREQLEIVADECLHWDGNQKNMYYSTSKEDADFIQFSFASTRRRALISEDFNPAKGKRLYKVIKTDTIYNSVNSKSKKIELVPTQDGFKYCFTVPSHMLVLRNNNCVFVTGNCGIDDKAYAFEYAKGIAKKSVISCGVVLGGQLPIVVPMNL